MDAKPLIHWHVARALVEQWNMAAKVRHDEALTCRQHGEIDSAIALENGCNAYRRCASELQAAIDKAES